MAAGWQMRNDRLGVAARGEVAIAIGETDDGIGIADIDPSRIGTGRIKCDAEWIGQSGRECRGQRGLCAARPDNPDAAGAALGHEDIAIRRGADDPRTAQARGKKVDFKAIWDDWLLNGAVHSSDGITRRSCEVRRWQILRFDQPSNPRAIGAPVTECGRSFEKTGSRLREKRKRDAGEKNDSRNSHCGDQKDRAAHGNLAHGNLAHGNLLAKPEHTTSRDRRGSGSIPVTTYAASAPLEAPAAAPSGINPATRLFSSGIASALHLTCLAGDAP